MIQILKTYQVVLFVLANIVLNLLGKLLSTYLTLPMWLDSVGTIITSYVLGPICGMMVGLSLNLTYSLIYNPSEVAFGIVSIGIAVITGIASIEGHKVATAVMDFDFMGGSMGTVVGEGIVKAAKLARKDKQPRITVAASGGARMQEGMLSLMQMARTTAAINELKEAGIPFISILTDPTTGGVSASFAMLGDVNIAEKGCLIGFAGQRVIEQTIHEKLPEGFQRAEYLLEHGMVDMVVDRAHMKEELVKVLSVLTANIKK